jgi:2,3-bisphosphoglycerate-independent phosphoglycerate mutase
MSQLDPTPARPRITGPVVLVVLDGFGVRTDGDGQDDAVALAQMPRYREALARSPHTTLGASGPDVGLPVGQMGNSEVGHLNLGAGRIAQMDIGRIDVAVADKSLDQIPAIADALRIAKANGGRLHLLGLVSDGGVHSSLEHWLALVEMAARASVKVVIHAFLDGRDTPPRSALGYLATLEAALAGGSDDANAVPVGRIGTVSGRFWAMDRDKRWDRVHRAYDVIVSAQGPRAASARAAVEGSYTSGVDDEFVEPIVVGDYAGVRLGDTALFVNFRADRARELTRALTSPSFDDFPRPEGHETPFASYVCMTQYDASLPLPVAFPKIVLNDLFPDVLAAHGKTQLRCAETEKFAHVTYFFDGGIERDLAGTTRVLVPSPRDVSTYDERPEMAAAAITEKVTEAIASGGFDFVLVNFANPDMVGHTGHLAPTIAANEAVDRSLGAILDATLASAGAVLITADHGNCEQMRDPLTGAPHTAHTTNPVPFVLVTADSIWQHRALRSSGRLSDVAPTMLELMGLPQPALMTGTSLLVPVAPPAVSDRPASS